MASAGQLPNCSCSVCSHSHSNRPGKCLVSRSTLQLQLLSQLPLSGLLTGVHLLLPHVQPGPPPALPREPRPLRPGGRPVPVPRLLRRPASLPLLPRPLRQRGRQVSQVCNPRPQTRRYFLYAGLLRTTAPWGGRPSWRTPGSRPAATPTSRCVCGAQARPDPRPAPAQPFPSRAPTCHPPRQQALISVTEADNKIILN